MLIYYIIHICMFLTHINTHVLFLSMFYVFYQTVQFNSVFFLVSQFPQQCWIPLQLQFVTPFVIQWRLVRGGRLIIMSGMEQMEWCQTHGNLLFELFDSIPLIPLHPLPWARPPQLRCHQPPVILSEWTSEWKYSNEWEPNKQIQYLCFWHRLVVISL